jgi:SAM-dependent methyltransferase
MLYSYGMKLGTRLALRGRLRQSLPYLIRPVNYWRAVEYRLVLEAGQFQRGERVLDVGSPKLLALYLARALGCLVTTTDIDRYFVAKQRYVGDLEGLAERLQIGVADGRGLGFASASFDKVYSISVLEHIPGEGDSACAAELGRVLAPGGRCVITVPFWPESRSDYIPARRLYWASHSAQSSAGMVFYQRRYSEADLHERIIGPSGLRLAELSYVGEQLLAGSAKEVADYLPALSGPVQPLLSRALHTAPSASWRALKKPLCALVVLEKDEG